MPPVAELTAAGTNPLGIRPTKVQTPLADGVLADCDATLGYHFFDVSVAECKSTMKPSAMTDDYGGKAAAATGWRVDSWLVMQRLQHEGPRVDNASTSAAVADSPPRG